VHAEYEREDRYHDQIGRALRTTSHTLAVRAPARNPSAGHLRPAAVEYRVTHLYDNDADPYQRQNLARDPGFVRLQRQLARRLTDRIGAIEGVEVRMAPDVGPGTRVLISSFDDLVLRWGAREAVAFYTRTCPRLFDRGAIAYWTASRASTAPAVIDEVGRVAQCVLELRSDRLRVRKAEGRPLHVQGAVATIDVERDRILVDREHTAGRLGEGLRRLRAERSLNQRELAQRAGVTPAAISQAESGRRGLSLDTVVRLCESLDVGLDDLLGIGGRPSPWLARHDRVVPTPSGTVPLFDDADAGARVHHVHLGEGQRGRPPQPHKGPEVVAVATGLVLVDLGESTPVLRAGDAVMASDVVVQGWTNLADGPSTLFWIAT